jgi:hypothetical protein
MQLGREHIQHLVRRGDALRRKLDSVKERLEGATTKLVRTVEVGAAAIAGGMIQGKAGPDGATVMKVPVDLGAGLLLNVAGYFNAAGQHSDHLNNLGDGFLASYLSSLGFGIGNTWRTTGKLFGAKSTPQLPGGPPATAAAGEIGPAQMADIISRVRAAQHG